MIDKFRDTGRPLLEILSDPNSIFIKGLSQFHRRSLYTNILNDRSAVYYTTSISATDPFVKLENLDVRYLEGYEDVLLDPKRLFVEAEVLPLPLSTRLIQKTKLGLLKFPFLVAFIAYIPIGFLELVFNSTLSAIQSFQRIKDYEQRREPNYYRVPFIQGAMEDVYQNLNNAQSHEYLGWSEGGESGSYESSPISSLYLSQPEACGKILALTPSQFQMIDSLNSLGWRKYHVHIWKAQHSHAAIIVRTDKPSFDDGRVVLRHWAEEEFTF